MLATAPPPAGHQLARSVARSSAAQMVARVLHLAINVGIVLALIRYFGPERYGDYIFVVSITSVLMLVSEFGLNGLAVLQMSRDPESAPSVMGSVLAARLGTAVLCMALAQLVCLAFGSTATIHLAVGVSSLLFLTEAVLSVVVVFHVALRQEYDALVRTVVEVVELAIVVVLVARSASLVAVVAAPVVGAAVGAALAITIARRRFGLRLRCDWSRVGAMLLEAVPLALIGLVGVLYLKIDALLLAALRPASSVGLYGAAYQPIENILLTATILVNVLFPLAAASFHTDLARFASVYRGGAEALVALLLPVPVLLAVLGPPLVDAMFEPRYAGAVAPLQVLAVALVFMLVNIWQGFVLVAAGRQRLTLLYVSVAIALNVAIDIPLISRFGTVGAAYGTLATAVFLATCSTLAVSRVAGVRLDGSRLVRLAVPGALLGALTALLHGPVGAHWLLTLVVAIAAWPVLLRLAGVFSVRQARDLLSARQGGLALAGAAA